jgi:hypothetical protein
MNFRQQIAKYVTGNLTTSQLPALGLKGLEEGFETPSLSILAGLDKNENLFVINQYFEQTLKELDFVLPDKKQAAIQYAFAIIDEILEDRKDVTEGMQEIINKAFGCYDFFSESNQYCYDSIGFHNAYGLFDTYEELFIDDKHLIIEKSIDQLKTETKSELVNELKNWRNNKLILDT